MKLTKLVAMLAALMMLASACAGDSEPAAPPETVVVTETVTVTVPGETVTVTETVPVEMDNPLAGTTVTVFGPESSDTEAGAFQAALDLFAAANGMTISYTGARDFSDQINVQVAGGNPPDIGILPQPGKLADFARSGDLIALPDDLAASSEATTPADTYVLANVDGVQYSFPTKADVKSNVWYKPAVFADKGYEVPETWDELRALSQQMIDNGDTPWCVGIDSGGGATGWPFTDWVEDLILRYHGADVFDQWVAGDVLFSDDRIVAIFDEIRDLWNLPAGTYAAGGTIATTLFGDNAPALVDDNCLMHKQANFFASFFPEGTYFGTDRTEDGVAGIDVFFFPPISADDAKPLLSGGVFPVQFNDRPEVTAVMAYMASADYANARQRFQKLANGGGEAVSGFISPNADADITLWSPIEQSFINILRNSEVVRFDGSDQLPSPVNSEFWRSATAFVNGDIDAATATENIDATWP